MNKFTLSSFLPGGVGGREDGEQRRDTRWGHIGTKLNLAYILIHLCGCPSKKTESKRSGEILALMKAKQVLEPPEQLST